MKLSIRTFLLINLLVSVTVIISLAILGNLFLQHKDPLLRADMKLNRAAAQMIHFTKNITDLHSHAKQYNAMLTAMLSSDGSNTAATKNSSDQQTHAHLPLQYQIWDDSGHLLLASNKQQLSAISTDHNFIKASFAKTNLSWRTQAWHESKQHRLIIIRQTMNFKSSSGIQLTHAWLYIMLASLPFLGILIWIIIGIGLAPLQRMAREISQRAPSNLSGVDMTVAPVEIKPMIGALNTLFERLTETLEREKRFASDAAHELRTPLAILSTQTQVALRATNDEERRMALVKLVTGVKRCGHVVHQLLTLSRMVPQAVIAEPSEVNITALAAEMVAELAPEAITKDIEIELDALESSYILGNPIAITILLRNLLDNALRYSPSHGQVIAKTRNLPQQNAVALIVRDTGPGIPEELRERVFERFFRILGSKVSGSGLGLGIVKQIIKLHNGSIELRTPKDAEGDPKESKGLEIYMLFPAAVEGQSLLPAAESN